MIFSVNILISSGFLDTFLKLFIPIMKIPIEVISMAFVRPISGNASLAILNTIYTKYSAIVNDVPLAKLFKNSTSFEMANMILKLPYLEQRKLMLYLLEKNNTLNNPIKNNNLVRDKVA